MAGGNAPHGGGPGGAIGRPVEKAKNFKGTLLRLLRYLGTQRSSLTMVVTLAVFATTFTVLGPKITGNAMETARALRQREDEPVIIFVTSSLESAVEGYSVCAAGFVLKPIQAPAFEETMSLGTLQLLPAIVSAVYSEWRILAVFLLTASITVLTGAGLTGLGFRYRSVKLSFGEGTVVASGAWFLGTLLCALPYELSGNFLSYLDCCFDVMSGLTTTGLCLIQDMDHLSNGINMNGGMKIDYAAGCTYINGDEIHLSPIEYKLLCLMSRNVGKVLTHNSFLKEIWQNTLPNDTPSLRVYIATLRKKIETPLGQKLIQTHACRYGFNRSFPTSAHFRSALRRWPFCVAHFPLPVFLDLLLAFYLQALYFVTVYFKSWDAFHIAAYLPQLLSVFWKKPSVGVADRVVKQKYVLIHKADRGEDLLCRGAFNFKQAVIFVMPS